MKKILSGKWMLYGTDEQGNKLQIPISVPGYVHPALEGAGILPPLYWRDNAKLCQWPEKHEWVFEAHFTVEEAFDISRARIEFGGVDTFADIFLNGRHIYTTRNAFLPFSADACKAIRYGDNILRVEIHPYHKLIEGKKEYTHMAFDNCERAHIRRIQCTFFWDWVERFVSAGICGDVVLNFAPDAEITQVKAETVSIADTSAVISLRMDTKRALGNGCTFAVKIYDPDRNEIWEEHGRVFLSSLRLYASIPSPRLWWPVGYGEHPLYKVSFLLYSADGTLLDSTDRRIGIRTVAIEMLRDAPNSTEAAKTQKMRELCGYADAEHDGEGFVLLVNGMRIFCKGGNWVPPTPFPDGTADYETLVGLAAKANLNLLRVWGGGVYEHELFYDLCDELGIMVTQDFMLSCGWYPSDDPEFVETLRQEVYANVLRLRHHPCIVFYSGNNENLDGFDWDDPAMPDINLVDQVFLPVLDELDPMRVFRPSNPYGGHHNSDSTVGESHLSWWWMGGKRSITPEKFHATPRFCAESPYASYPSLNSMSKFLAVEDMTDPRHDPIVEYHIKNNEFFTREMNWPSIHERLCINSDILLGVGESVKEQLYRYIYIGYEWGRLVLEATRRNKWYSSAIQFWMYNDCWPALGYSTVDFYGRPKAGWYATLHCCKPIAPSIHHEKDALVLTCLNDGRNSATLTAKLIFADPANGTVTEIKSYAITSPANENIIIDRILPPDNKNTVVFLELWENGVRLGRSRWYYRWIHELELSRADVSYSVDDSNNTVTAVCHSGIAFGVAFDGALTAEDSFIDLLPNESVTVSFIPDADHKNVICTAYNAEPVLKQPKLIQKTLAISLKR